MHLVLIPIGSAGDVHPYVGIGCELARRGHRVTVLTNEHFRTLVERAGLEFVASSSEEEYRQAVKDPRLWDPMRGFEFVARHSFLPLIGVVYQYLRERHVPGETLVVGASFAWGARIAQEKLRIPLVTLHLQPAMFPSLEETPRYTGAAWVSRLPRLLKRACLHLIDRVTDGIVAQEINAFRASVGLAPVRRILREWTHSPLSTIGLFPEWFARPGLTGRRVSGLPDFRSTTWTTCSPCRRTSTYFSRPVRLPSSSRRARR